MRILLHVQRPSSPLTKPTPLRQVFDHPPDFNSTFQSFLSQQEGEKTHSQSSRTESYPRPVTQPIFPLALAASERSLGNELAYAREYELARSSFSQAAKKDIENGAIYYESVAQTFLIEGNWFKAAVICDKAIAMDPDFLEAHWTRARALFNFGELAEAVFSYKRALELKHRRRPPFLLNQDDEGATVPPPTRLASNADEVVQRRNVDEVKTGQVGGERRSNVGQVGGERRSNVGQVGVGEYAGLEEELREVLELEELVESRHEKRKNEAAQLVNERWFGEIGFYELAGRSLEAHDELTEGVLAFRRGKKFCCDSS